MKKPLRPLLLASTVLFINLAFSTQSETVNDDESFSQNCFSRLFKAFSSLTIITQLTEDPAPPVSFTIDDLNKRPVTVKATVRRYAGAKSCEEHPDIRYKTYTCKTQIFKEGLRLYYVNGSEEVMSPGDKVQITGQLARRSDDRKLILISGEPPGSTVVHPIPKYLDIQHLKQKGHLIRVSGKVKEIPQTTVYYKHKYISETGVFQRYMAYRLETDLLHDDLILYSKTKREEDGNQVMITGHFKLEKNKEDKKKKELIPILLEQ